MGWNHEDHRGHEGFAVGFAPKLLDGRPTGLFRELGYPDRDEVPNLRVIAAACECGWRSPRLRAPYGTEWFPSVVAFPRGSDAIEDVVRALWKDHLEDVARMRRTVTLATWDLFLFARE